MDSYVESYLAKLVGRSPNARGPVVVEEPRSSVLMFDPAKRREAREALYDVPRNALRKVVGLSGATKYTSRNRTFILITGGSRSEREYGLLLDELILVEHERRSRARQQRLAQGELG